MDVIVNGICFNNAPIVVISCAIMGETYMYLKRGILE